MQGKTYHGVQLFLSQSSKKQKMEHTTVVETPQYKVEKKQDSFEIRTYAAYILAQIDVESDFDGALRNGFEILAQAFLEETEKRNQSL
ncbi:MAG: heme-binding protein [Halobacteriota archaeon]